MQELWTHQRYKGAECSSGREYLLSIEESLDPIRHFKKKKPHPNFQHTVHSIEFFLKIKFYYIQLCVYGVGAQALATVWKSEMNLQVLSAVWVLGIELLLSMLSRSLSKGLCSLKLWVIGLLLRILKNKLPFHSFSQSLTQFRLVVLNLLLFPNNPVDIRTDLLHCCPHLWKHRKMNVSIL